MENENWYRVHNRAGELIETIKGKRMETDGSGTRIYDSNDNVVFVDPSLSFVVIKVQD